MILEIVDLQIKEGSELAFELGVAKAIPVFQAAEGFVSLELRKVVEDASSYKLFVQWDTIEDHTVTFRNSDGFQTWRLLVGQYFAAPPQVAHNVVVTSAARSD